MKKIYLLTLLFALFAITSCSSDDDNTTNENYEKIVGTWTFDDVSFNLKINNNELGSYLEQAMQEQLAEMEYDINNVKMQFNEDKTFKETSPEGTYTGKYVISKNKLSFKYDDAEMAKTGNMTYDVTISDNYMTVSYDMKNQLIAELKAQGVSLSGIKIEKCALSVKYKK